MEITALEKYDAILQKDTAYEGIFFTAVKTTGIFCRPSCTARKPKFKNVEFFDSTKEAILHGYRPCKVCKPLERLGQTPPYIEELLDKLNKDPSLRFKDYELRMLNIEPSQLRRWFLKNHGITFHAYQRMNRINSAFKNILNGDKATSAAFDAGYGSVSGFSSSFKSIVGTSPSKSRQKIIIDIKRLETPLGTMFACATIKGICLLEFTDRRMLETEFRQLCKLLNGSIVQGANPFFPILEKQLNEYFAGHRKTFTVPLLTPGTDFQNTVWSELQAIPYGSSRSYKQQAILLHKPEAVRAVAQANGMNRISILIPCHRVIGENGNLTGYGGGLWRKKWLLHHEQKNVNSFH